MLSKSDNSRPPHDQGCACVPDGIPAEVGQRAQYMTLEIIAGLSDDLAIGLPAMVI